MIHPDRLEPPMNDLSAILVKTIARLNSELEAWQTWEARQKDACTVISGQPFIVACDGGMALRLQGNASIPTPMTPGLCGISHFSRKDAEKVASLRGAPYRVVVAAQVPQLRIAEIRDVLATYAELQAGE